MLLNAPIFSLPYPPEAAVVILGVPEHTIGARIAPYDDTPRPPVSRTRRGHRVLLVVPARPGRQQALTVEEGRAVLGIRKGPSPANQRVSLLSLARQGAQRNLVAV